MNFRENNNQTLIIYQISQNKSIYSGARFFDPLDIDFRSL